MESPAFFKRLGAYGMWFTGAAVTVAGLNELPGMQLPEWLPEVAGHLAVMGATITIISRLPVQGNTD